MKTSCYSQVFKLCHQDSEPAMESFTITCEICQFSVTATTFFVIDLVILLSFYNFAPNY